MELTIGKRKIEYTEVDKVSFFSALFFGVITHLYAMTNKLPAIDDLSCINSYGAGAYVGRWFLEVVGLAKHKIFGNYSAPAWNGLVTLLFVAVASVLLCRILELTSKKAALLTGTLMAVFPVLTSFMLYIYTAYYYCLGLVLVLLGVYIEKQNLSWKNWIIGSACIALGIAIYQAFLPFAISLFLVIVFLNTIKLNAKTKQVYGSGFASLASILFSVVLYLIPATPLRALLHIEAGDIKGAGSIGSVFAEKGLGIVPYLYKTFLYPITTDFYGLTSRIWLRVLVAGVYAMTLVILLWVVIGTIKRKKWGIASAQVLSMLLLPIGLHSIYAMVEEKYFYTLMFYSEVLVFLIPVALLEQRQVKEKLKPLLNKVVNGYMAFTICMAALLYTIQASGVYLEMDLSLRAMQSYYTSVITQIKSLEDYDSNYPVVFLGTSDDPTLYGLEDAYFKSVRIGGSYDSKSGIQNVFLDLFLQQYCGYDQKFQFNIDGVDMEKVADMPCYPKPGSIAVIDERIVIKFSDLKETR